MLSFNRLIKRSNSVLLAWSKLSWKFTIKSWMGLWNQRRPKLTTPLTWEISQKYSKALSPPIKSWLRRLKSYQGFGSMKIRGSLAIAWSIHKIVSSYHHSYLVKFQANLKFRKNSFSTLSVSSFATFWKVSMSKLEFTNRLKIWNFSRLRSKNTL